MSITLKSGDGESFTISDAASKKSPFIQKQVEGGKDTITFEQMRGEVLSYVVEYLNYYVDKDFPTLPEVLKSNDLKSEVNEWDFSFIDKISYENCFHLINAGLLLEINHLYDLACTKIAAFMKGKSPEQVNEEFTIECQLTQDEAKQLGLETN